ncbi:MAG TPA: hypothetical protein VF194_06285 [Ferrovibrio sp.]|uniref:hypothetical protein n=1 Tax=Ferrovibrio sp. TaxID=1917215 RepID=UPI002ECFEDF7
MSDRRKFSPADRRNWGYWDGRADAERGRMPPWNRPTADGADCPHPFDRVYGEAYWAGWRGEPHPNDR